MATITGPKGTHGSMAGGSMMMFGMPALWCTDKITPYRPRTIPLICSKGQNSIGRFQLSFRW